MKDQFSRGLLLGAVVGTLLGFCATRGMKSAQRRKRETADKNVFVLGVSAKFKTKEDKDFWLENWKPLVEYVRDNEKDCIAYDYLQSDQDELCGYILERYRTKEDLYDIHNHSQAFKGFIEKMKPYTESGRVSMELHTFYESNIGFV
mmetsp:Transcript_59268/g.86749  ORF Transcript_59268/g.86749 Transcript_59268/m.86749 type:complete len:147 (+) Transcript_59268:99-539(+)